MKKILIALMVALMLFGAVGCSPKIPDGAGDVDDDAADMAAVAALEGYLGAFGHVRTLGDIDHLMKGEKVDDEEGVTVQSMTTAGITIDEGKTAVTIPLTLTGYDFDGHRNGEADAYLYTREATGTLTLVLTGKTVTEGEGEEAKDVFKASSYEYKNVNVKLACDDVEGYISLGLPEIAVKANSIKGIFADKAGKIVTLDVTIADGKAAGIADVNTAKFTSPAGTITIDGKATEL